MAKSREERIVEIGNQLDKILDTADQMPQTGPYAEVHQRHFERRIAAVLINMVGVVFENYMKDTRIKERGDYIPGLPENE